MNLKAKYKGFLEIFMNFNEHEIDFFCYMLFLIEALNEQVDTYAA